MEICCRTARRTSPNVSLIRSFRLTGGRLGRRFLPSEIMRKSGGQAACGLETAGSRELLLCPLARADIAQCARKESPPGVVAPLADRQLHVNHAAVLSTGGHLAANPDDLADASL